MSSFKNLLKAAPGWAWFFVGAFLLYLMAKTFGKN